MTSAAITILATMLTACAAPTAREVCGTSADGWQWCVTIQERQP